jgi:hypothetical protein
MSQRDANDPLEKQLGGEDAADIVAALELASIAGTPSIDGSSWVPMPTFAAECIYLRLLSRDDPAAPDPAEDPRQVMDMVVQAEAAVGAEVTTAQPAGFSGLLGSATARFSLNQTLFYDPAIAWAEYPRLRELFDPFSDELTKKIGFDVEDSLRFLEVFNARSVAFVLREAQVTQAPTTIEQAVNLARAGVSAGAGRSVRRGAGEDLALSPAELCARSGRTEDEVESFLRLFAVEGPCNGCSQPFGEAVWMLRRRPILRWGEQLFAPVACKLLTAIRPALESVLRDHGSKVEQRYVRHKGKWLEQATLRLLDEFLEPDELYRTLRYPLDDGQLAERDALARVDLFALAVESKAGGITPRARAGGSASQRSALDKLVHDGIGQAESLIAATKSVGVTGVDRVNQRVPVDIGKVTRFVPVTVTLEDLGGVSARYQTLFEGSREPAERPLVVNVDDFAWYGTTLGGPARLLHYLVVRQRISGAAMAVYDEADWFRLYLQSGGAGVQEWIDNFAALPTQVIAHSGESLRGVPDVRLLERPAPFLEIAERWRAEGRDGWLEASFALFDLSDAQVEQFPAALAEAGETARANDAVGIATFRPAGDLGCALHAIVPPGGSGQVDLNELGPTLAGNAPDADRHVITGSRVGTIDDLALAGLATIGASAY